MIPSLHHLQLSEPPQWEYVDGLRLQDNKSINKGQLELLRMLAHEFNDAVDSLPALPLGWNSHQAAAAAARPTQEAEQAAKEHVERLKKEKQ